MSVKPVAVALGAASILVLTACSGGAATAAKGQPPAASVAPATTAPKGPTFGTIGQPVRFDGGASSGTATINGTRRITKPENAYAGSKPTAGSWLVVDVTVQVERSDSGLLVSYLGFTAQTPDGRAVNADGMALKTPLSTSVAAGRQIRGEVAFDVAQGELVIDWTPGLSSPAASWKINA